MQARFLLRSLARDACPPPYSRGVLVLLCLAGLGTALVNGESAQPFSLIVLPDTQRYTESASLAAVFQQQTEWIVEERAVSNIQFVIHLGDLVEHDEVEAEWVRARAAMTVLDTAEPAVPYGVLPGNHDVGSTFFNKYFGVTSGSRFGVPNYSDRSWWGGSMPTTVSGDNRMNFQLFSAGGIDFVIIHMSYLYKLGAMVSETSLEVETGDPSEVETIKRRLQWVDAVLKKFTTREAILVTHRFLANASGIPTPRVQGGDFIWEHVLSRNPNLFLVLNGHELGNQAERRRADLVDGRPVHQLLSNYQDRTSGGNGWLRILRFVPSAQIIEVKTYSPRLDAYETDDNSQFTLEFVPRGSGAPHPKEGAPPPKTPANLRLEP